MYSDRVDSVTRATNPSLPSTFPSCLPPFFSFPLSVPLSPLSLSFSLCSFSIIGFRDHEPPPSLPPLPRPSAASTWTRHLSAHRRIKHGPAVSPESPFVIPLAPSSSRHLLSLSFACLVPLSLLPLCVSVDFSAAYPSPPYLAPLFFIILSSHSLFLFPPPLSLFLLSRVVPFVPFAPRHIAYRVPFFPASGIERARSRSRVTKMSRNAVARRGTAIRSFTIASRCY